MKTTRDEFDPHDWSEFYGQPIIKERLGVACRSVIRRREQDPKVRLDHILLDGPGGSGKSTLANLLADRLGENYRVLGEPLNPKAMLNELYDMEPGGVLFVDEIHTWPKATLNGFLPFCESGWFGNQLFPYTTLVAATTEPWELTPPLRSRFILCKYESYTLADMTRIVQRFAHCAGVALSERSCRALAAASGGMPRTARSFVIAARDLAGDGKVPPVDKILRFCNHFRDGLSTDHVSYLHVLHDNRGRAGLETLKSRLGVHESIVRELERTLVERKLVFLASDGRTLTAAGRERLQAAA